MRRSEFAISSCIAHSSLLAFRLRRAPLTASFRHYQEITSGAQPQNNEPHFQTLVRTEAPPSHPFSVLVHQTLDALRNSPKGVMRVANAYELLSSECKKTCVRPHKSLSAALQKAANDVADCGFEVSHNGLWVKLRTATFPPEALPNASSAPSSSHATLTTSANASDLLPSAPRCVVQKQEQTVVTDDVLPPPLNPLLFPFPSVTRGKPSVDTQLAQCRAFAEPNDYYFGVPPLDDIPPPPSGTVEASKETRAGGVDEAAALSVASFVRYIPSFFVPLDEVVRTLPEGYTEEHINQYLCPSHKTVQVVTVEGRRWIRIFGGYSQITFVPEEVEIAENTFQQYYPDPALANEFAKLFEGNVNTWMPLRTLLARAPPALVAKLAAFQVESGGATPILFFAQMQHRFSFSPENGGAVLLRPPRYDGLTPDTTPCPVGLSMAQRSLPLEGFTELDAIQSAISPQALRHVLQCFPSVEYFVRSHGKSIFYVMVEGDDKELLASGGAMPRRSVKVCRMRYKERLDRNSLPLQEQLAIAIDKRDKKLIRRIRRKMALAQSPDSPLVEKDFLAKEIHKSLPRKGHVQIKLLLRDRLPEEILNFMPKNYLRLFQAFPELFQLFELHTAGNWCLSRVGNTLPSGVLRKEFTDEDVLRVLAQVLSKKSTARACSAILLNLPEGAQKAIRQRHNDMYTFVMKYPQYFSVVLPFDHGNAKGAALVHLLQLPVDTAATRQQGDGDEGDDDSFDDDESANDTSC